MDDRMAWAMEATTEAITIDLGSWATTGATTVDLGVATWAAAGATIDHMVSGMAAVNMECAIAGGGTTQATVDMVWATTEAIILMATMDVAVGAMGIAMAIVGVGAIWLTMGILTTDATTTAIGETTTRLPEVDRAYEAHH